MTAWLKTSDGVGASLPEALAAKTLPLAQLRCGEAARVSSVRQAGMLGERLMEMGLTPGTLVKIVRRGPFGDPLQLSLRGYMLSLRRTQALRIDVLPVARE